MASLSISFHIAGALLLAQPLLVLLYQAIFRMRFGQHHVLKSRFVR